MKYLTVKELQAILKEVEEVAKKEGKRNFVIEEGMKQAIFRIRNLMKERSHE